MLVRFAAPFCGHFAAVLAPHPPGTPPAHFAAVSRLSGPISRSPSKLTYEVAERNFATWGNIARNAGFPKLCTLICWKRWRQSGSDRVVKRFHSAGCQHDRARQSGAAKREANPLILLGRRCRWGAAAIGASLLLGRCCCVGWTDGFRGQHDLSTFGGVRQRSSRALDVLAVSRGRRALHIQFIGKPSFWGCFAKKVAKSLPWQMIFSKKVAIN